MRAWQKAYRGMVSDVYLDNINLDDRIATWRQNLLTETLANGWPAPIDYVVEVDGSVGGFANVGLWRDEATNNSAGELWAMYVHPDHWGQGLGYVLMKNVIAHFAAHSLSTGYLWVLDQNAMARRFYERQGWTDDDVLKQDESIGETIVERRYSIALTQST